MKYTYAYKTSDGVRHEAAMDASSREEVFEALRAQGIKAIKVIAADGSKANGEEAVRRRLTGNAAILAAVVLAAVGGGAWWWAARAPVGATAGGLASALVAANSSPRHQIYGDPAVMEAFGRGDFGDALPRDGDRLLAVFAQPGRHMCAKGVDPRDIDSLGGALGTTRMDRSGKSAASSFAEYAHNELSPERDIAISDVDSREVRELKQIVNGMREEMREYLANGNGTPRSYWRRLNERTSSEMQIYERTRRELEGEKSPEVWDEKNAALRRLGLRTIPNPNE